MSDLPAKLSPTKADDCSPINYARVVILGDRGVGKTALIKVIESSSSYLVTELRSCRIIILKL